MTINQWFERVERELKSAGIESAKLDAKVLAESVLNKDRAWLAAHGEYEPTDKQIKMLDKLLKRRAGRLPLAYVTGSKEFYGLDFKVTPDVLVPRPETERLVEEAVKLAPKNGRVLDMGTGSGCVAVSLLHSRKDLEVTATDVSAGAIKIAKANARKHDAKVTFILSDLFEDVQGRFDLILANLPYVPEGGRRMAELDYEPQVALYAGADGLDYYRQFMPKLKTHLTEAGQALIESGPTQRRAIKLLAEKAGFKLTSLTEYISLIKTG